MFGCRLLPPAWLFGWLHLLNPGLILISVFLLGVGFAFNAPAWISMAPQIVSDAELPAAVTLSGLQLNISGIIGPWGQARLPRLRLSFHGLAAPLSINFTGTLNLDPATITSFSHRLVYTPQPRDGAMSITVDFKIDCARARQFLA